MPRPSLIRALLALTMTISIAAAAACEDNSRGAMAPAAAAGPADATYTVRGRIADVIGDEVSIQHEEIPTFQNREGETVGMMTMTMAFHRPASVSMDGIATGDAVELTFEMRWEGSYRLTIASLTKLPADTELEL